MGSLKAATVLVGVIQSKKTPVGFGETREWEMDRILVVDEQQCVRRLLRAELILAGYDVVGADGAERARGHLGSFPPALVLLGVGLDRSDEVNLLGDMKAKYPDVPVIVMTTDPGDKEDPRFSKADGYFIKSFDFSGLKRKIAQVLRREIQEREGSGILSPLVLLAGG